jgi:hypothetical protein
MIHRSGVPKIFEGTIGVAPSDQAASVVVDTLTTFVSIECRAGGSPLKVYLTLEDFTNDRRFLSIAAGQVRDLPIELHGNLGLFVRGNGGDAEYCILIAQRAA